MDDTFTEYVTARGAALLRFAFVLCGDRHLAEDLVQDVLARVHRKWAYVEATQAPEAYIRKAIVHGFLSWRRRLSTRELTVADVPESLRHAGDPGDESRSELRDEMWRLLATLPRSQRAVLTLRFYEDLTFQEIGVVLGCAPNTARVHASRGLAKLRIRLDPATGLDEHDGVVAWGGRA